MNWARWATPRCPSSRGERARPWRDAGYIRELKALGYSDLPLDEVVRLRDHGVTAERIKKANEKAGTKLPLDMVRSMVDGGFR